MQQYLHTQIRQNDSQSTLKLHHTNNKNSGHYTTNITPPVTHICANTSETIRKIFSFKLTKQTGSFLLTYITYYKPTISNQT